MWDTGQAYSWRSSQASSSSMASSGQLSQAGSKARCCLRRPLAAGCRCCFSCFCGCSSTSCPSSCCCCCCFLCRLRRLCLFGFFRGAGGGELGGCGCCTGGVCGWLSSSAAELAVGTGLAGVVGRAAHSSCAPMLGSSAAGSSVQASLQAASSCSQVSSKYSGHLIGSQLRRAAQ